MSTLIPPPEDSSIPDDDRPEETLPNVGDFDPQYPGSTPDAPYGFKPNGEPYKRRPNSRGGAGTRSTGARMPSSESAAKSAAGVLSTMNILVGMSLNAFGFQQTSVSIVEANSRFEAMAADALMSDPVLCKKILSAGSSSGKVQLGMAYATLAMAIMPAVKNDIKEKRNAELE